MTKRPAPLPPTVPTDSDGMVDLTTFQMHPLNPNTYGNTDQREGRPTSDKWKHLVADVKASGGPCTKVEVWKRPDGAWEVLSGWHNVKACIEADIDKVPANQITVVTPKDEAEAIAVVYRRNLRGKVDTNKVAILAGDLSRRQGRSYTEVAELLLGDKRKKPQIQKMVGLYDLLQLVDPKYQHLVKRIPQKGREAVLKLVRAEDDRALATVLVRVLATPATFVYENDITDGPDGHGQTAFDSLALEWLIDQFSRRLGTERSCTEDECRWIIEEFPTTTDRPVQAALSVLQRMPDAFGWGPVAQANKAMNQLESAIQSLKKIRCFQSGFLADIGLEDPEDFFEMCDFLSKKLTKALAPKEDSSPPPVQKP